MEIPRQTTINQYLEAKHIPQDKKEKVVLAITDVVYVRNQNVIKAEAEKDEDRRRQLLRSIEEYDDMIVRRIDEALAGKQPEQNFDF